MRSLEIFEKKPLPTWGGDLTKIDFQDIYYYVKPTSEEAKSWEDVPADMKRTFDKLGIPEAEQKFLSGVGAQYDSEVVYHKIKEHLEKQGVIFLSCDQGLRDHEELFTRVLRHRDSVRPTTSSLRSTRRCGRAARSSTCPRACTVDVPLQAYFRINTKDMGQFERTLIIVDEGAYVHYVEGCTAPIVLERLAALGRGRDHRQAQRARCRYTTIQNWSNNVYNLVTQARGRVRGRHDGMGRRQFGLQAHHEVSERLHDGAGGARRDPVDRIRRQGPAPGRGWQGRARGAEHDAARSSRSRSARTAGAPGYRGLVKVVKGAVNCRSTVNCDALILDEDSRVGHVSVHGDRGGHRSSIGHEATVSKIGDEQLFYLTSRGIPKEEAAAMIVSGFIEPIVKELPMEYAVEMNRLIQLQMEGSVG